MQFGLFSNGERHNPIAKTTYDEDLAEVILADEIGGFGVLLLLAGEDWGTYEQRMRSMHLFMSEVAPRLVNLNPDDAAA
jgi:hypothetical protein